MKYRRYYSKSKASAERKAIQKAFNLGAKSMNAPIIFSIIMYLLIGIYIGYMICYYE